MIGHFSQSSADSCHVTFQKHYTAELKLGMLNYLPAED